LYCTIIAPQPRVEAPYSMSQAPILRFVERVAVGIGNGKVFISLGDNHRFLHRAGGLISVGLG
jgi:hypothetical protein